MGWVGQTPVVLAPVRAPDVDFGFVREYHVSPVFRSPEFVFLGPFVSRFPVAGGEEGLLDFFPGLETHRLEGAANSLVGEFMSLPN